MIIYAVSLNVFNKKYPTLTDWVNHSFYKTKAQAVKAVKNIQIYECFYQLAVIERVNVFGFKAKTKFSYSNPGQTFYKPNFKTNKVKEIIRPKAFNSLPIVCKYL